jgi:hypothetical protein
MLLHSSFRIFKKFISKNKQNFEMALKIGEKAVRKDGRTAGECFKLNFGC